MAKCEAEAKRVGAWRNGALWGSLAINGAARARFIRGRTSAISFAGSTGVGGVLVAFIWTRWDGVGVAVVSPWNKGGEEGVRVFLSLSPEGCRGPGNRAFELR